MRARTLRGGLAGSNLLLHYLAHPPLPLPLTLRRHVAGVPLPLLPSPPPSLPPSTLNLAAMQPVRLRVTSTQGQLDPLSDHNLKQVGDVRGRKDWDFGQIRVPGLSGVCLSAALYRGRCHEVTNILTGADGIMEGARVMMADPPSIHSPRDPPLRSPPSRL